MYRDEIQVFKEFVLLAIAEYAVGFPKIELRLQTYLSIRSFFCANFRLG